MIMQNNLIIITFDQMRADFGGSTEIQKQLKNINSLIERGGVSYNNCYTTSPQCIPARISWITGKYPSRWGIDKNEDINLQANSPSFIRKLKNNGWKTYLVGKTHWTSHRRPKDLRSEVELNKKLGIDNIIEVAGPRALRHIRCSLTDLWEEAGLLTGFINDLDERYNNKYEKIKPWVVKPTTLPNELYPDIWIADQSIKIIENIPDNQPWVLWISFVGPHEPFDTPKEWAERKLVDEIKEEIHPQCWLKKIDKNNMHYEQFKKWEGILQKKEIFALRKDYIRRNILLDEQVGKILKKLLSRTDYDRTSLLLTSDHGEMLGDHGMLYKGNLLQQAIQVPFIYLKSLRSLKNDNSGRKVDHPLSSTDLIKNIINEMISKSKNKRPKRRRKNYAFVEYNKNTAVITEELKCVFDSQGSPVWCTDMKKDNVETDDNIFTEDFEENIDANKWKQVLRIRDREAKKRRKESWVINDLKRTN